MYERKGQKTFVIGVCVFEWLANMRKFKTERISGCEAYRFDAASWSQGFRANCGQHSLLHFTIRLHEIVAANRNYLNSRKPKRMSMSRVYRRLRTQATQTTRTQSCNLFQTTPTTGRQSSNFSPRYSWLSLPPKRCQ